MMSAALVVPGRMMVTRMAHDALVPRLAVMRHEAATWRAHLTEFPTHAGFNAAAVRNSIAAQSEHIIAT